MRTLLMLLVLTIVAVTGSKHNGGKFLLEEIMDEVEMILNHDPKSSKTDLNQFVKVVFPPAGCSEKHLCQAAKVMMNTDLNRTMLHRRLFDYAKYLGHHHCHVPASEEHRMEVFLTKINECCKEQYSKLPRHKKDKK